MTQEEAELFRKEFRSLVYQKYLLKDNELFIQQLSRWDKNGSHEAATLKALEERKKIKSRFNDMLKGRSYDHWLSISRQLSAIKSRSKGSERVRLTQEKKLAKLQF